MNQTLSTQRKLGTLLSYAMLLCNTIINLAYVPILLTFIGISEFGLYRLLGSIIAYFNILDFGLSTTIIRFLVKYRVENNQKCIDKLITMSLILYMIIGIILCLIGLVFYYFIPTIFSDSLTPGMINSAKTIFILLLINLLMLFSSKVFDAIIISKERFVFHRLISLLQIILQPFFIVATVYFYPTALSVVIVQTLFNLVLAIIKIIYCRYKLKVVFRYYGWDNSIIISIRNLSISLFVVSVVDQIFWQSSQLLIGMKISAAAVAVYAIASQIYINYMNISLAISGTLLPKVTTMVAENYDDESFQELFLRIGRLQFYLLSFITSCFIIFGHGFLHYWVGDEFSIVYSITLLIIIPFTIDLIQNVGLAIMQARNVFHIRAMIYTFVGILNIVLSYYWIDLYGVIGGALATGLCMLIGNGLLMNIYYQKYLKLDIFNFWKKIFPILFVCILTTFLGNIILSQIELQKSIYLFISSIVFYSLIYFTIQWKFIFNSYEKGIFYSVVSKFNR
jgi:polysaccharide biosynthesis protein